MDTLDSSVVDIGLSNVKEGVKRPQPKHKNYNLQHLSPQFDKHSDTVYFKYIFKVSFFRHKAPQYFWPYFRFDSDLFTITEAASRKNGRNALKQI